MRIHHLAVIGGSMGISMLGPGVREDHYAYYLFTFDLCLVTAGPYAGITSILLLPGEDGGTVSVTTLPLELQPCLAQLPIPCHEMGFPLLLLSRITAGTEPL